MEEGFREEDEGLLTLQLEEEEEEAAAAEEAEEEEEEEGGDEPTELLDALPRRSSTFDGRRRRP